ncbi:MAG: DUF899 family protein [Marinibacterium sp.]
MPVTFPGESSAYRAARNALLKDEVALRALTETVAARRRGLPAGGNVPIDYVFHDLASQQVPLSALFGDHDTLAVYSLMYRPDADAPCPMCVSMLDGLSGQATHLTQRMAFAVVAAARPDQLVALQGARGWQALRLLSADGTTYQADYHGEAPDGSQLPMMNVFRRQTDGTITHFWGSEGFFADVDGQPRHVDLLWPLWNMLDLTPGGRGSDWYPALSYDP